ncbi:MAG TPA: protein kinase [Pyrinomonadaceae bacterium]|nr:protein kinase [Pyrinomonadaceae bacterium]
MASETIIGNYRIEELIGRGGMGVVYRGHHLQLPREVAIKSIDARDTGELRHLKQRFEKEAYVQSQLDHPGIVKIYDYIADEKAYYIVMEYVEGRSLAQLMAREASPPGPDRALDFFEQMLTAVSYAHTFVYRDQDGSTHRGLVHRDLKPANILITPEDTVKITDFGIVKLVGSDGGDTLGGVYGSPEYVSPEQADGQPVDQRSDIYSLGVILYEMLAGTPPFWNKTGTLSHSDIVRMHIERAPQPPSERNPAITPEIEALVLRALEKRAEQRFATAEDFLRAVRQARGRPEVRDAPVQREGAPLLDSRDGAGLHADVQLTSPPSRESYVTQPVGASSCPACGAGVAPADRNCRACGHELNASPATVKLTRNEAAELRKRRRLDIWIAASIIALVLAVAVVFYARRTIINKTQTDSPAAAEPQKPTPAPDSSTLVELKPARVLVDSSFDGYEIAPLTDGETDVRRIAAMRYNKGNWASAETETPHWIEVTFDKPVRLAAVYLYWGFDRNRFMPSRRVELQSPDESGQWRTVTFIEPNNDHDRMAFDFAPLRTSRARIFQPAKAGPVNRPFVMWVREVKLFGQSEEK